MLKLEITKRTDPRLLTRMENHYSKPRGFVGRNICYAIYYDNIYYGHIVGGSATLHLPGRNEFFGIDKQKLNNVVNNIFYNVSIPTNKIKYPIRNFTTKVILEFENHIVQDWKQKYNDNVIGLETLIELPRTGDLYIKAQWNIIGQTKGYTCKRTAGIGTDNWSGKRIWNKTILKPKLVLAKKV